MFDPKQLYAKNGSGEGITIPEMAELKSSLRVNPNCKFCKDKGNKGYYGINQNAHGSYHLLMCCGVPGETEYCRLQKEIAKLSEICQLEFSNITTQLAIHDRHTLIGGTVYLWRKIFRKSIRCHLNK